MAPDPQHVLREIEDRYQPLPEGLPSVAYIYEPGLQEIVLANVAAAKVTDRAPSTKTPRAITNWASGVSGQ